MNYFFYLLIAFALFQTTNGEIEITLLDEKEKPIAEETIQFVTEQQEVLASCVTNGNGRCTITLDNAPADPSGFIRGTLAIKGRGRRPVIWPGGPFELTLTLDEAGKLPIPSDLYVTRTPKVQNSTPSSAPSATGTSSLMSTPSGTPFGTPSGTPSGTLSGTPSGTLSGTLPGTPSGTPPGTSEDTPITTSESNASFLFQIGLLIILTGATIIYVWLSRQSDIS